MKRLVVAACAALMVVLFSFPATAQVPAGAKFALHLQAHAAKSSVICTTADPSDTSVTPGIPCSSYTTSGLIGVAYDMYVVIAQVDSNGVAGVTFGIDYDGVGETNTLRSGVDVVGGWFLCSSGLQFPSDTWPDDYSGNVITWNTEDCAYTEIEPDDIHGTAGAFYVYAYSPDTFRITAHKQQVIPDNLELVNCTGAGVGVDPESGILGSVDFSESGSEPGCNPCVTPCLVEPVEPTTWGGIKTKY